MIYKALDYIKEELAFSIDLNESEISVDNLQKMQKNKGQGLILSLLKVEEEITLKNAPNYVHQKNTLKYKEPAIYLNLNVIMAFDFDHYSRSLKNMSNTAEFFQAHRWFSNDTARAANPFPANIKKLILDLQKLSFEQLNHIWSISGGILHPALVYKVRLLKLQSDEDMDAPEIETIQLDSDLMG